MKIAALGYIGVGTPRRKEWERFGPEILGTPLWTEPPGEGAYLRLDERAYRIAVHPAARDELQYVGWEVAIPGAIDEAVADLERAGFRVERGAADDCRADRIFVRSFFAFWKARRRFCPHRQSERRAGRDRHGVIDSRLIGGAHQPPRDSQASIIGRRSQPQNGSPSTKDQGEPNTPWAGRRSRHRWIRNRTRPR